MSFVKYDVQTDSAGAQLLKVHDYKAGAYVAQAAEPSGGDAVPADAVTQPPRDEAVPTDASLPPVGDDVVPKTTVSLPTDGAAAAGAASDSPAQGQPLCLVFLL